MKVSQEFGSYDAKGHWHPGYPSEFAPLFQWPIRPLKTLKWLLQWGGYLYPSNLMYVALGLITVLWFQPSLAEAKNLEFGWIGYMLLRNFILLWVFYGGLHLIFYTLKLFGNKQKYHPSFHQEKNKKFLFHNQVYDNVFRSNVFSLPLWTFWEVMYWWAAANGLVPTVTFEQNPVWFVSLFFLIPLWRAVHFYCIHRLIHWGPLMRHVHSVHHKNPNPGPWTGLSMHPLEGFLYLSVVAIHFFVPSSPWHFFFHSQHVAIGPAAGHLGFEGPMLKGTMIIGDYYHYLHHKFVSCNFGLNTIPMDKWWGRYFDGIGEYRTKPKP